MVSLVAALTVFATIDEAAISGLNHAAAIPATNVAVSCAPYRVGSRPPV